MRILACLLTALAVTACASTSAVMEAENDTFMISASAAPARGGSTGATNAAYEEAQKFCAARGGRAIVMTAGERDVHQSMVSGFGSGSVNGFGGSAASGFGGASLAAGRANLHFRCSL